MNDNNYKESTWYKIERFFDRHNHLMEFIRTILALLVLEFTALYHFKDYRKGRVNV